MHISLGCQSLPTEFDVLYTEVSHNKLFMFVGGKLIKVGGP